MNLDTFPLSKEQLETDFGIVLGSEEKVLMLKSPNFKVALLNEVKERVTGLFISLILFSIIILAGKYFKWEVNLITTTAFFGIVILVGIYTSIKKLIRIKQTKVIITNQSIIISESGKNATVNCIQLDSIETIELKKTFFDKHFNTGTLKVYTGKTKMNDDTKEKIYDHIIAISESDKALLLLRSRN